MKTQAELPQPGGQSHRQAQAGIRVYLGWSWLLVALLLLVLPFNRGGLWDPSELRFAELGRRLAHQLFGCDTAFYASEPLSFVTKRQIGQGELAATSPAVGFALFGVSDWAGRVTSLGWGAVTLGSLWAMMARPTKPIARNLSVLLLASLPVFAWQSRTLLGDAATIGTLALATAALSIIQRELLQSGRASHLRSLLLALAAIAGLGGGVLARGVLVGVAVPALSVGIVGATATSTDVRSRALAVFNGTCLAIGAIAAWVGIRELATAPQGFSFLLGATMLGAAPASTFANGLSNLLHQVFPLAAVLPMGIAIALTPRTSKPPLDFERHLAMTLTFVVVFSLVAVQITAARGATLPFPALAALAGLAGLGVARLDELGPIATSMSALVTVTIGILIFADFVNLSDTAMLLTGAMYAKFPESFRDANQVWLGAACAVLGVGCVPLLVGRRQRRTTWSSTYRATFEYLRNAFSGQLLSGFVLVETALVTTALLQRTHDQGWINVPVFDSIRTIFGALTSWAWIAPPVVLFVVPLFYVTVQLLVESTTRPPLRRKAVESRARASAVVVFAGAVVSSGLIVSLGHAPALAEQLSSKRAIRQYGAHARPGEPLALLGIKPEATSYYLGAVPRAFSDIEAAARWLGGPSDRRPWLVFERERLPELNAAFRSISTGKNLVLLDPVTSNVIVATNRHYPGESQHNPLAADVLQQVPRLAHDTSLEFGSVFRLTGWDIKNEAGTSVSQLVPGVAYELQLAFQVLGTTAIDWQIFVHVDGRGRRHNADHDPVSNRYPTTLWQRGDAIVDRHKLVLERGTLPGPHTLYFGFFRGSRRLDVTVGEHEDNRVKLGQLEIR